MRTWEGKLKRASLIAAVGAAVSPLILLPATGSVAATSSSVAAPAVTSSVTYHGSPGSAARLTQAASVSSFPVITSIFHNQGPHVFAPVAAQHSAGSPGSAAAAPSASANAALSAGTTSGGSARGGVVHQFNGMDNLISDSLNKTPITPPDQGLCVGYDAALKGHPKAVWEPVNIAAQETSPSGKPLRPDVTLSTIFQDQYAEGDVRCLYDPGTQSFYFTEIGFPVATGPPPTTTTPRST